MRRLLFLSIAIALASACGDDTGGTASNAGGQGGSAGDAGKADGQTSSYTLRIEPSSASATVIKGQTPPVLTLKAFATPIAGGAEQEVTADSAWSLQNAKLGTFNTPGTLTLAEAGGKTNITASYKGATATALLTVKLTG